VLRTCILIHRRIRLSVEWRYAPEMSLTLSQFSADRHGAAAVAVLTAHPVPTQRLLDLLNDPVNEQKMVHAEELDRPPMAGVIHLIEGDAQIAGALGSRTSGIRFRQAVAVAVKMKMLDLGWSTTGRQGPVPNSKYYEKGERFKP
jgi:hypothetical protein